MSDTDIKELDNKISSKEPEFTSDIYADIYRDLITNYKHETKRQHTIRAVIQLWMKKYRMEASIFEKQMKKFRETRSNEFAADKQQDQRHMFKIPETLWTRIVQLVKDPEFLSESNPMTKEEEEEYAWFIREFPMFVVPETI